MYVRLLGLVLVTNITIAITNRCHLDPRTTNGGTRTTIALAAVAVSTYMFSGSSCSEEKCDSFTKQQDRKVRDVCPVTCGTCPRN